MRILFRSNVELWRGRALRCPLYLADLSHILRPRRGEQQVWLVGFAVFGRAVSGSDSAKPRDRIIFVKDDEM